MRTKSSSIIGYTIAQASIYDITTTVVIANLVENAIIAIKMNNEVKEDIKRAWSEVDKVLGDIAALDLAELIAVLPTIKERLRNAHDVLGKYVSVENTD